MKLKIHIFIFIVIASFIAFNYFGSHHVVYDGYIIRNFEHIYFAPNSPLDGNDDSKMIWINNEERLELEKKLEWRSTGNHIETEYTKIRIGGDLYGPGEYGHLGDYRYEINVTSVEQL